MPWNVAQKKFIRDNSRNTGTTVWDDDAVADQLVDSGGHDYHDQDLAQGITECLNINGINDMAADLKMGTNKVTALAPGTAGTDGTNKDQLDAVDAKADQNTVDISNLDARVTTLEGSGAPDPMVVTNFRSQGSIRHKLNDQDVAPWAVNVNSFNRHYVKNDGAGTLTFTGFPAADDPDIGNHYHIEGQIIVENGASPGAITIDMDSNPYTVLGGQDLTANKTTILSYIMQWHDGTLKIILLWST